MPNDDLLEGLRHDGSRGEGGGDETAQSRFCDGDALANYFHSKARSVVGAGANVRRVARQRLALFPCQTPGGSGWRASATKCGGSPRRVVGDRLS
jgi:hypothetical protein